MTSAVAAIIEREIEQVSRFISILNEEQDALKRGEVAALSDLISRKTPLVESLNALENERLVALDLPSAETGAGIMDTWLAINSKDSLAAVNWKNCLISQMKPRPCMSSMRSWSTCIFARHRKFCPF